MLSQFKLNFQQGLPISIAVVGDSTSGGFGANGDANWIQTSPYAINLNHFPSQAQQDNTEIPSAVRLLRSYVESVNPLSKVYNFGGSGYKAASHLQVGTIAQIAALTPKPQIVFIATGINSAKNNQYQTNDLIALINQVKNYGMIPVIVIEHNIAIDGSWTSMPFWLNIREATASLAQSYDLDLIDLGTPDGAIDTSLLHDAYHPSAKGYQVIFQKYKQWLSNCAVIIAGKKIGTIANGEIFIKTSKGLMQVKAEKQGEICLKTSKGTIYF